MYIHIKYRTNEYEAFGFSNFNLDRNLDMYTDLVHVKLVSAFTAMQCLFTSILKNFNSKLRKL